MIVAQIIGILAMLFNIWSYQQKQQKFIIAFQLIGSTLFTIHFFMLNAYMGAILNAVGILRAVVFLKEDFFHSKHFLWIFAFISLFLGCYVLTFTAFKLPFTTANAFLEFLPVFGMTATTFAFHARSEKSTRLLSLLSSPAWLTYNIIWFSIGAICCESFTIVSIAVGLLRFDLKKEKTEKEEK